MSGTLNIIRSYFIASFVGSPFWRNGVGGCGFLSTVMRFSTTAANLSAKDVSGICVCLGKNCTVFDFRVSLVDGT